MILEKKKKIINSTILTCKFLISLSLFFVFQIQHYFICSQELTVKTIMLQRNRNSFSVVFPLTSSFIILILERKHYYETTCHCTQVTYSTEMASLKALQTDKEKQLDRVWICPLILLNFASTCISALSTQVDKTTLLILFFS